MGDIKYLNQLQKNSTRPQLVTIEDLEQFKTELQLYIKALLTENTGKPVRKWLKSYEVKKILGCSSGTLHDLRANGTIPCAWLGKTPYYDSDDIDRVLQERKRQNPSVRHKTNNSSKY
jgi:hypothetical protein